MFISSASEDKTYASELAGGLTAWGIKVWYDDYELQVGDKLLNSINRGLEKSDLGILVLSPSYLKKNWPSYELDILIRQHVEKGKRLLPIWHNITKEEIERNHPILTGIVGVPSNIGLRDTLTRLLEPITEHLPTVASAPSYEDILFRFLEGHASLTETKSGRAFTIWEALIHIREDEYPIGFQGKILNRHDLLYHAAQVLEEELIGLAAKSVGKEGAEKILKECIDAGLIRRQT